MKNTILIFVLGFLGITLSSCITSNTVATNQSSPSTRTLPAKVYSLDVDKDGVYEIVDLEKEPVPNQGQTQWVRDFYTSMSYPTKARENGIEGIVILEVLVDEFGHIQTVSVKKSLSGECDNEARRAFLISTQQGYTPLMINSSSVAYKMDIPIGFWLG